jgi:hypothetical protein
MPVFPTTAPRLACLGGQLLLLRVRPPFLLGGCFRGVLPHLNGHGGGLGRRNVLWCWWRDLEASRDLASCALPMRQPHPAAAIQGHKVGRAVLDDDEIARSYFPVREDLVQSCSGNNWEWGGAAVTRQATGEFSGPDCMFEVLTRVCSIKVRGHIVFSFFLWASL